MGIRRVYADESYDIPENGQPVLNLKPGDQIMLKESVTLDNSERKVVVNTYKVVKKFPNFWLLIRNGLYICFQPWEIQKRQVMQN